MVINTLPSFEECEEAVSIGFDTPLKVFIYNQEPHGEYEEKEFRDGLLAVINGVASDYQRRVGLWMQKCFGAAIAADKVERSHRFFEEAAELVQSIGMTEDQCIQLVRYVYGRPAGQPHQEVGGVKVTLATLCTAIGVDETTAGEDELARVWTKIAEIRAKQASKPHGSVLPVAQP